MKYFLVTLLGIGFVSGICSAGEKLELKDQKDKESYSLGYQFGQSLKLQEVEIDLDTYTAGIRDALAGTEPRMDRQEIRETINGLQQRVAAVQAKAAKERAEKNLAEGKAFLAENGKKEGVKILPSGLQYKVLAEGSGKTPAKSDTVAVHYRGTFINGTEFDSSHKRGQSLTLKVDGVIPGWTEALQLMKEGAKWQLFVPSELAYGERGMAPRIPPNSPLIFEVELVSVMQN